MPASQQVITVRPEEPQDEAFLFELYASTRQEEMDALGWSPEMRTNFLKMQFKASQGYRSAFPGAEFHIVLLNGANAGRLIVNRSREELRIVDVALLPEHRGAGIGTALLQRVFGEATGSKKPLRLKVLKGNRAGRLYQRLGFVEIGETDMRIEMEWRAPVANAHKKPGISDVLKLALQFDAARLRADLARMTAEAFVPHFNTAYFQGDWSALPLRSVGGRADHIYPDPASKNSFADTPLLARCPGVQEVLAALPCPHQAVRFLRLKTGSSIKEHRDMELGFEDGEIRLHIPVITNPGVEFMLAGNRVVMNEGECWYLNFNLPHRVDNRGATDRIHLVIDCVVNNWLRDLVLAADTAAKKPPPG
jgi:ribosomal protein S18 acetylase RimI-like enzyme